MVRRGPEVAALLVERNGLAGHLARGRLPPLKRDPSPRGCPRCFAVSTCAVAHRVFPPPFS